MYDLVNERGVVERQRSAPCQDRTGDLQNMRLTLYQLSQRSFNAIGRLGFNNKYTYYT